MKFRKLSLAECGQASGVAVVIDVLRAFTAEAFAFHQGAREIIAVGTVEEALAWRKRDPSLLVMGEVNGRRVPGFDLWNSPAQLLRVDLTGRRLVHRTSAGTQGILGTAEADTVLTASFVVARATAELLRVLAPEEVDFIVTGKSQDRDGDEDTACADYITALLQNPAADPAPYLARIHTSDAGRKFYAEIPSDPWLEDLRLCVQPNRFDFAMQVYREKPDFFVRPVKG